MEEIEITTFEQFMDKFGDKDANEFEESLKNVYGTDLNEKYYWFLKDNFDNLPEEEKLKFTVEQAEKIKNGKFVIKHFHYITVSEMKNDKENANKKLSELAKKIDSKSSTSHFINFLIYYFSNFNIGSYSILEQFKFDFFSDDEIEFIIKYKNFFLFINNLLKQKYTDFECKDFLLEMEENPQNVFDYLTRERSKGNCYYSMFTSYLYIHMEFGKQTPERFGRLGIFEISRVISYAKNNESINITQEHVDLINVDYYKNQAQKILDSRNKQEHDTQNVQGKEIKGSKSNKIWERIKLFLATLFSLVSIASIIIGVIAIASSLLTLPFSPWILVGVSLPVLAGGVYFFCKSVKKNFSNLSSMANQSNAKEKSDDNSVIPKKDDKENGISEPEVEEEEEDKNKVIII